MYCTVCTVLYVLYYMYCTVCTVLYVLYYMYCTICTVLYAFAWAAFLLISNIFEEVRFWPIEMRCNIKIGMNRWQKSLQLIILCTFTQFYVL